MQWIIATFTNEPHRLARYAGLAKGCLACGLAASFGTESGGLSQLNIIAFNFSMQAVGLVCMFVVCWISVKPTMYFKEENFIPPMALQVEKGGEIDTGDEPGPDVEKKPEVVNAKESPELSV